MNSPPRSPPAWSPGQYLKFEDERSRPAIDLLAHVPLDQPKRVVDIGCGPGNSTEILLSRFPDADVIGLDSSAQMLEAAQKRLPGVSFIEADISRWTLDAPVDLLFANATFQWVPGHLLALKRLAESLSPGGVLAVQMPDNLAEPSHTLMREVAHTGRWKAKFDTPIAREEIATPEAYYDLLRPVAANVDIWHVIYNHPLDGVAAITEWVKATGLRPYLDRLDVGEQRDFLSRYERRLADVYPSRADGKVLLRFPRIFIVAVKP